MRNYDYLFFSSFSWYPKQEHLQTLDEIIVALFHKLCSDHFLETNQFEKFILAVKKSYRPNPHHNFEHAFLVLHGMFNILMRTKKFFTDTEVRTVVLN